MDAWRCPTCDVRYPLSQKPCPLCSPRPLPPSSRGTSRPSGKTTLFEFRGQRRVVLLAGACILATLAYQIAKLVLQ